MRLDLNKAYDSMDQESKFVVMRKLGTLGGFLDVMEPFPLMPRILIVKTTRWLGVLTFFKVLAKVIYLFPIFPSLW